MLIVRTIVVAVLSALFLSWSFPASAGGPTSVLLSVPGEGRTASLYYTDAAYDQLFGLVTEGEVDGSGRSHAAGTEVTVTWLIHDVTPWRIDRVYLAADGGPWVATQEMGESGSVWEGDIVWRRPSSAKELSMLLDGLGLGLRGGNNLVTAPDTNAEVPAVVDPVADPVAEPPTSAPAEDSTSGAWWALGGLVAGVLLALGLTRARSSRREDPASEQVDLGMGGPAGEAGIAGTTVEERLVRGRP